MLTSLLNPEIPSPLFNMSSTFLDEFVILKNGVSIPIVHHYGHDSYGVQCSWGSAHSLVELIKGKFN